MANIDAHFAGKQRNRSDARVAGPKWSGRRTVAVAFLASGTLWLVIFWVAKALVV